MMTNRFKITRRLYQRFEIEKIEWTSAVLFSGAKSFAAAIVCLLLFGRTFVAIHSLIGFMN